MNKPPDKKYFKTVKTSLKSLVKHDFVIRKINETTITCNKIVTHSLQFLKLYILDKFERNEPLPIIDKQFVTSVMKTICVVPDVGRPCSISTQIIKDDLKIFYDLYYKYLQGEKLSYLNMNTILDYLAVDIITMYENNIKQHYIEYIEKYVNTIWRKKLLVGLIRKKYKTKETRQIKINKLCNQLRRIKNDIINNRDIYKSDINYHNWIDTEIVNILPQKHFENDSVYYDLKCPPQDYLHCMLYTMAKIESYGEKINTVCPMRTSVIPKHIRIDTTTIVLLLFSDKQGNKRDYIKEGNLVKFQDKIWSFFFRLEKKCFYHSDKNNIANHKSDYKFNYMIETDGISCSILLLRNDITKNRCLKMPKDIFVEKYIDELEEEEYLDIGQKNIVSIDPNMSDLIYCTNGKGTFFRYTQDQRRKELKIKKYRNILQVDKLSKIYGMQSVTNLETEFSQYNKKTLDFNDFQEYIKQKNLFNKKVCDFYNKILYRKLKLNSYINNQQTEKRLLNRFEKIFGKPEDVIIGFGDFEQYKHRKYKEPVKGKGFRSLFRKSGYKVYLVDEFRTSCRCSLCGSKGVEGKCSTFRECINPRPRKNNVIFRHGLVKCKTCSRLWNRDTNASLNIYQLIKNEISGLGRPEYLKRKISGATSASD